MNQNPKSLFIAEVQSVIKNLKNNKAQGCDNLTNEHFKEGGKELTKNL